MADENTDDLEGQEGKDKTSEPKKNDDGSITISQDELNRMMADNRRNLTRQNEEMANRLEALQSQFNMTAEERDEMKQTIESLRTQTLTQDELQKREAKKAADAHKKEIDTLAGERDQWKGRYESETVMRAILDASSDAYEASQIVAILGPKTRLTSVKNEETGEESLQPITKYEHVDEDGKPKTLEISPQEAVKLMKETRRYHNLFISDKVAGLGLTGSVDMEGEPDMDDMAKYMKWRESNKATLGI
jgi:parvulin-like peptidyl-prolyl isomerase